MRLVLLGDADDARGFRLAGVESMVCRTRDDVDRAVAELAREGEAQTALVLVSAPVYQIAPSVIDALQNRPRWPIVLMLPDGRNAGRQTT